MIQVHLYANRYENLTLNVKEVQQNLINEMDSQNFTCEISQNGNLVQSVDAQWILTYASVSCIGVHIYPVSGPVNGGTSIIVSVNNEDDEPEYFFIDGANALTLKKKRKKIRSTTRTYMLSFIPPQKQNQHFYKKVEVGRIEVYIGDLQYQEDVQVLAIIVGVLAAALVIAVVIGILSVVVLRKKKRKAIKEFKMELMTREEMVRKASREEFADAQMTMRNVCFSSALSNQDITINPLLQNLEISDKRNDGIKTAMDNLEIFVSTFFISSDNFTDGKYETLLRFDRLSDVLFRRFESITLRLMANWLQIGLYGQLTSNCGMQLFMLYKAVQTIVEMAPIDALTSNSKNTIAEEKLLKMRIEHQSITLQIDLNGNSDKHYAVKVLDCDTISQASSSCNETIKAARRRGGKLTLNDIDNTSERNNGLVCLNTLKHYMVKDNSRMALMYKQHDDRTDNAFKEESLVSEDITLLMPEDVECSELEGEKWHLETNLSNVPAGQSNTDADFGDIFLNRLFLTKLLLSDYIDTTFESLIDPQSLSIPIRYFIGVLDKLGKTYGVEQDVLQSWKNECVPAYVGPCMDILKQVFVESFTQTAHKVNKESLPQKLLFHKDIPRYRKLIGPFFIRLEPVTDKEFWSEMDEISDKQKSELRFSRQSALHQLYNLYIGKYKSQVSDSITMLGLKTFLKIMTKVLHCKADQSCILMNVFAIVCLPNVLYF
ncbi:PLXNA [Mytilus edulis]|uniref:PLXNA n=1 Tax=Mytilus edulis TaxID=6550 RepID=A0A8S3R1Y9_MYTED|nr:PLXNA [Mytilus edulis]